MNDSSAGKEDYLEDILCFSKQREKNIIEKKFNFKNFEAKSQNEKVILAMFCCRYLQIINLNKHKNLERLDQFNKILGRLS